MTYGFIGTGTISAAIIAGLNAKGSDAGPIVVSPRSAAIAARLAADFANVSVGASNQEVVDRSDFVFLAVRPQIVDEVVGALKFRAGQTIVSLVATVGMTELAELVAPATDLVRAVPLPFVEHRLGPTIVFPAHEKIAGLFDLLGKAIVVASEREIDVLMVASCTMGSYFSTQSWIAKWLGARGIDETLARSYLATMWFGLADAALRAPDKDFAELSREFSTAGGLNEQVRVSLEANGAEALYGQALDGVRERVEKGAKGRSGKS